MNSRMLGKNGPAFSILGLGTWAIGGPWAYGWGKQDDQQSIDAIHYALDHGINWIDTAAVYGLGHSEEVVGKAIQGKRDSVWIASKCGLVWDHQGAVKNNLKAESIRKEAENSLRRLKIDTIDLFQFHWPDPETAVEESFEMGLRLQEEGKIRWLGVSNFDIPLMESCLALGHIDSLQPPFSLIRQEIKQSILPFCEKNQMGVVSYSPMANGLLSGTFNLEKLAHDDWRLKNANFQEPRLSKHIQFTQQLSTIAKEYNATVGNIAVAWVLHHSAITSAIVGIRNVDQVSEMLRAAQIQLSAQTLSQIDAMHHSIYNR